MIHRYKISPNFVKKSRPVYVFDCKRVLIKECNSAREASDFTGICHSKIRNHIKYEKPCGGYIVSFYLHPKLNVEIF